MRLSDAVAFGLPEIVFTNDLWILKRRDGTCKGCLAGAALWANGKTELSEDIDVEFAALWPWTKGWRTSKSILPCPACASMDMEFMRFDVTALLTHLASHYKAKELTSAQIIEYLRSVEPAEPEPAVEPASPRALLAGAGRGR